MNELEMKVLDAHPNMKDVVCTSVAELVMKPNTTSTTMYRGVLFLSEIQLKRSVSSL
jgi:hypothetical protein